MKSSRKKKINNQNFLTKSSYADNLTGEFYKTFKEWTPLFKFFQHKWREHKLLIFFQKPEYDSDIEIW